MTLEQALHEMELDDEIGAVRCDPAHQHMDMRIVGVPMVDRDPVEPGVEVDLKLAHEVPRIAAQVSELGRVLGADDEAEVVAITCASFGEGIAIGLVASCIEHRGVASVAGHAVALEITDVPPERRGAVLRTAMPDDATVPEDAATSDAASTTDAEMPSDATTQDGALPDPPKRAADCVVGAPRHDENGARGFVLLMLGAAALFRVARRRSRARTVPRADLITASRG